MRRYLIALIAAVVAATVVSPASPALAATARPAVSSLSSQYSGVAGGERIVVHGARFTAVRAVRFGTVAGKSIRVTSSKSLSVVVPRHAAGLVNLTVVSAHGTSPLVAADHLRFVAPPTVSSVSPAQGPAASTTKITVHGTNFVSVERVIFGSAVAAHLKVVSASTLTVDAPRATRSATVNVRVRTKYGLSPITTHGRFAYHAGPAPVTGLTAVVSATSTALTWSWSSSPSATSLDIRRVTGATPPTPATGVLVATVDPPTVDPSQVNPPLMRYRDLALSSGTQYAYALFVHDGAGGVSTGATAVATTSGSPTLAPPIALSTSPSSTHPTTGPCRSVSGYLATTGGGNFYLGAYVANPDFPTRHVRFQTQLTQTDPQGQVSEVIAFSDERGWSNFSYDGADALVSTRLASPLLVDGDAYTVSLRSYDGVATSAAYSTCAFSYDATAPSISVSGPVSVANGQPATFIFTGADVVGSAGGEPSGLDYFVWASDSTSLYGGGTRVSASGSAAQRTASITLHPTTPGTNYLFVAAVDVAGNQSAAYTYPYYVLG